MSAQLLHRRSDVLLGLGANQSGRWGNPPKTLVRALAALAKHGVRIKAVSPFYETAAIGQPQQPAYLNAVAVVTTHLPAPALLRVLKRLERQAGRRGGKPWGPRSLDIDIIDYRGLANWPDGRESAARARAKRALMLPHPYAHERPFVLKPLLDVAPAWHHPVLRLSARELWRKVASRREGRVLQRISAPNCASISLPGQGEPPK